ncbi:MAG TPA: tRNA (guanosine(37)-N1)-methyltransferase TrmD [Chlamydiales bacterium]|nr:tRNA (guanosine(37)-N1)-methyltransferase TrmD [Chlamydiales bacterium]
MEIEILSLFPEYFRGPFDVSMLKRARDGGYLEIRHTDIREFAENKHARVDDRPFGGGPGMVLCPGPVARAIRSVRKPDSRVIYLSPQGSLLTAAKSQALASSSHLILLCGHYEGVDERVLQTEIDEEISIGDYVLTNGCAAAIVLIDAMARFIPGVIGHPDAVNEDSFQEGIFDSPHYTRPEIFEGMEVPPVLLGGNHAEIRKWRKAQALNKTRRVRPDLLLGEHCEPLTSHSTS